MLFNTYDNYFILMSNLFKNLFKKQEDDNIPDVKLQKNEPNTYYCKVNKVWMIEGQEEEILKELATKNKPPPVKAKKENNDMPKSVKPGPGAKKPNVMNRYAVVLPAENIDSETREPQVEKEDRPKAVKPFVPQIAEINLNEEEVLSEPIKDDILKTETENSNSVNEKILTPEKRVIASNDFKVNETVYVIFIYL